MSLGLMTPMAKANALRKISHMTGITQVRSLAQESAQISLRFEK